MPSNRLTFVLCLILTVSFVLSSCAPAPALIPAATILPSQTPIPTLTPIPTGTLVPTETVVPTQTMIPEKTYVVEAGDSLWSISLQFGVSVDRIAQKNAILDETRIFPGQVLIIPNPTENLPEIAETDKWIHVILSEQKVYAYEGDRLVREFIVSTGVPAHPTVQGTYYIYVKLESTRMTGDGYNLPNVPWTMYFYEGYSFHGTYWHHNFGHPMSHGCINMYTPDADWLYHWALVGTKVVIDP